MEGSENADAGSGESSTVNGTTMNITIEHKGNDDGVGNRKNIQGVKGKDTTTSVASTESEEKSARENRSSNNVAQQTTDETGTSTEETRNDAAANGQPDATNARETEAVTGVLESATESQAGSNEKHQYEMNPSATLETSTTATTEAAGGASSKSAQILLNRFSSWKQKANQNAQALLKKANEKRMEAGSGGGGVGIFQATVPKKPLSFKSLVVDGASDSDSSSSTASACVSSSDVAGKGRDARETPSALIYGNEDNVDIQRESATATVAAAAVSAASFPPTTAALPATNVPVINAYNGDKSTSSNTFDAKNSSAAAAAAAFQAMNTERTKETLRKTGATVSTIANQMVDSVATGFRGRYTSNNNTSSNNTHNYKDGSYLAYKSTVASHHHQHSAGKAVESQTSLILKSRAASYMQQILSSLQENEYVMLLGNGMLGVNLKQCYLKNHGVYVDYLVNGKAAHKAGVVSVGDRLIKVADVDVRKGTIADVPTIIAQAKRPAVLVLSTGTRPDLERINYVDIAVAIMHNLRRKEAFFSKTNANTDDSIKQEQTQDTQDIQDESHRPKQQGEHPTPPEFCEYMADDGENNPPIPEVPIPFEDSIDSYVNPPSPPLAARQAYAPLVGQRCNDNFEVSQLSQAIATNNNFRAALRNAFLTCAIDNRKFPYVGRHFSLEKDIDNDYEEKEKSTPNALLMLFLELMNFADFHGVTPATRIRDIASRIAQKFFLPTKVGNRFEPPMFDFHHIVPDASLRKLEAALKDTKKIIPRDIFFDFQQAVVDSLSGSTFLLFLVSNECARMRATLRNTSPYVNVSLRNVVDALADTKTTKPHPGAKNYFLYILIYLLTQVDKEPYGENEIIDGDAKSRILGSANGICCSLFIYRHVIPAMKKAQESGQTPEDRKRNFCNVVEAFDLLWEVFVVPGEGSLEQLVKSGETEVPLAALRLNLRKIRKVVLNGNKMDEKRTKLAFAERILDSKLLEETKLLADQLLYDYASTNHATFREHKFHEWMCYELAKLPRGEVNSDTQADTELCVNKDALPVFAPGCIKRLLRRVHFPVGISSHKPIHSSPKSQPTNDDRKTATGYPNADLAVVFGSSVGSDLAAQMASPAMDHSDIRRYICQDVTSASQPESLSKSNTAENASFEESLVVPTLESYAILPRSRSAPFSQVTGNLCLSSDGWEISLLNFMIPNADSGSEDAEDSALYGVSLVFQQNSPIGHTRRKVVQTQFISESSPAHDSSERNNCETKEETRKEDNDSKENLSSPISFHKHNFEPAGKILSGDGFSSEYIRTVNVSVETPTFKRRLQEKPWIDRVYADESRDKSAPATIAIALVSRRNVICAMRQTLHMLLRDYSRQPGDDDESSEENNDLDGSTINCGALVDILGNFAHQDVEPVTLKYILEPYLQAASSPWLDRPLLDQKEEFERLARKQLIRSLPPIPLALMFITALLEQKIVFSSSRRTVLLSASVALTGMFKPLKWCHLSVPLVPAALARDLLQYPAPFILGMPSEDPGIMELLNNLPKDVTLVDLDVGRVILASSFVHDADPSLRGASSNAAAIAASALRSQVLYLAQVLGSYFGTKLYQDVWSCDSPLVGGRVGGSPVQNRKQEGDCDILQSVCQSFVDELLSGISSCFYWVEEGLSDEQDKSDTSGECTVLFDEDRFFHIKDQREKYGYEPLLRKRVEKHPLALSLDDFDLVFENLLRCQSVSWYISSSRKNRSTAYSSRIPFDL